MKFGISQQISEIEREIVLRANVYARLVNAGKMRQSVADYQTDSLKAVLDTLIWFKANEAKLRAAGWRDVG